MRIVDARVIVCSPGRNFVTLKLTTEDGVYGLGDATLNGRELAVAALSLRARRAAADRPRRAPDRRHLAVPVQGRVLAARSRDHGRDRRGRHGALGHQGQVARTCRSTSCSAAPRATRVMVYGHANGADVDDTVAAVGALPRGGLQGRPRAERYPGSGEHLRRPEGAMPYEPAERGLPPEHVVEQRDATSRSCRRSSSGCARSSAPTSTCCTTSITA